MTTIAGWEKTLRSELKKAKLSMKAADVPLAWEVFRRLLQIEVEGDAGAWVQGEVTEDYDGDFEPIYELTFCRYAGVGDEEGVMVSLAFRLRPPTPLKKRKFWIRQRVGQTDRLLPLDEFLDRCYASEHFNAVLTHGGKWTCEVRRQEVRA